VRGIRGRRKRENRGEVGALILSLTIFLKKKGRRDVLPFLYRKQVGNA